MQTRGELYDFLDYHSYEEKLNTLFSESQEKPKMSKAVENTPSSTKKSVVLSGVVAGNTAICSVGRTGNDLHYRGYDILDIADSCEFEEIAYLLVHEKLPTLERTGCI